LQNFSRKTIRRLGLSLVCRESEQGIFIKYQGILLADVAKTERIGFNRNDALPKEPAGSPAAFFAQSNSAAGDV
jgi:hypothetical protein